MIHEVLLALLGHVGGLINESEDGFLLSSEVDFLSEGECNLVEHIVKVGFYCKRLSEFVTAVRSRHFGRLAGGREGAVGSGVVLGHYAYGMAQRVEADLDAYRERVVDLEAQVLREPTLSLAYIASCVEDDRRILHALHRLLERVEAGGLSGGPLLDLLWDTAASHMGVGRLHGCLWSLVSSAGQVLANQLVAWAVYGRLVDPDGEFFIGRIWDQEIPWHPGAALHGGPVDDFTQSIDAEAAQREWQSVFFLRAEAVPHGIVSLETARKVLFVGKAVRVLLRSGRWLPSAVGPGDDPAATATVSGDPDTGAGPDGSLDPPAVQDEVDALRTCFDTESPTLVLDCSVETIRASAASQLRQLIVDEAGLAQHLLALKGFYLLGHGAFYQTLLEASRPLLRRPPPPHAEVELTHGPWAAAMAEHEVTGEPATAATVAQTEALPDRSLASRFEIRFVPQHFELQSFADATRQVKLIGMARLVGGHAELGAAAGGGTPQPVMLWLATRQRVARSFSHAFSFQVHAPPAAGVAAGLPEHGCRFALCLQHRWAPAELQRRRQAGTATMEPPSGRGTPTAGAGRAGTLLGSFNDASAGSEGLGWTARAGESWDGDDGGGCSAATRNDGASWTSLEECLALEVTYRALHVRGTAGPSAEISLVLYICHPGLGDGCRPVPGTSGTSSPPVQQLAEATLVVPAPRGMVHLVRLWYDAKNHQLQVFFGADAVAPACTAQVDIGSALSLDLGCAYAGFCLLPLDHQHQVIGHRSAAPKVSEVRYSVRDRPLSIISWRHNTHKNVPGVATADVAEGAGQLWGVDAWFSCTELSYRVPWPLPLVITRRCVEQYNRLFRLLLAFRHVHLELQRLDLPRGDLLAWALRSELSYFVSQVLLYFQQDVIEASHSRLLQAVQASKEFDELLTAHEGFLAIVTAHCFLKAPELHSALMAALRIGALFCSWANRDASSGTPHLGPQQAAATVDASLSTLELHRLQAEFTSTVRSVLRMMISMHQHGMHTHLSQLLLRLDYNGYFSGTVGG